MFDEYRNQPQNQEAEMAALGAAMFGAEAAQAVTEALAPGDYYVEAHGDIHRAIAHLVTTGRPVDMLTLSKRLEATGHLDKIGGGGYLAELVNSVHTMANVEAHCALVSDASARRQMIRAAVEMTRLAYDESVEVDVGQALSATAVAAVGNKRASSNLWEAKDLARIAWDRLEARMEETAPPLTSTGLIDLDELLEGLCEQYLYVLAARPSMGKTALALTIAINVAKGGKLALVFSLEMKADDLMDRAISTEAKVNGMKIRKGMLNQMELQRITRAIGVLSELPFMIEDTSGNTLVAIKRDIRKAIAMHGPIGLVVIDYLQLIETPGGGNLNNRTGEISAISRGLKGIAREFKVPVIALSQLSREVEKRTNKRPMLSDLRESGAIEQDADAVMFVYRDDYYDPASDRANMADIIVAKHRTGPTGTVTVYFNKDCTTFQNMELPTKAATGWTPRATA